MVNYTVGNTIITKYITTLHYTTRENPGLFCVYIYSPNDLIFCKSIFLCMYRPNTLSGNG